MGKHGVYPQEVYQERSKAEHTSHCSDLEKVESVWVYAGFVKEITLGLESYRLSKV